MTSIRAKDVILLVSLLSLLALGIWYLNNADSPFDKCLQKADKKMEDCKLFNRDHEACEATRDYDYEGCEISRDVGFGPTGILR